MSQGLELTIDLNEGRQAAILRHGATLIKILSDLNIENTFSSDTQSLTEFIIAEMQMYSSRLTDEDISKEALVKATYLISSAFDDVYTRKKLYGNNAQQGFLLNTHNEPGVLSRFWDITDELARGVNEDTVDVAILALSIIEIGYLGKYESHPDCFAIVRTQREALELAIDEFLMSQNTQPTTTTSTPIKLSPVRVPVWAVLSLTVLLGIGMYYGTQYLINKKFNNIETIVSQLEDTGR